MIKRAENKLRRAKLEVLKPYAHNYDIEHTVDYARPGNTPPERAFHLLSCGFDAAGTVLELAFPSLDKRARKLGSKWARESLPFNGAHAGRFMASVVPLLFARMDGFLGAPGEEEIEPIRDPEVHLSMKRLTEDFYRRTLRQQAAGGPFKQYEQECLAEFDVLDTGQPRQPVAEGKEAANEFSLALLREEDPRQDPELVRIQREYARDYFIHMGISACMLASMFASDAQKLHPKVLPFLDPNLTEYRANALAAWVEAARPYREYLLIEAQSAGASQKQQWASTSTG